MENNLEKSNDLLLAIIQGTAFDKLTGKLWSHWIPEFEKQVELNNLELCEKANDYTSDSVLSIPYVSLSFAELKAATLKYNAKSEYQQAMIVILRNIFKAHKACIGCEAAT